MKQWHQRPAADILEYLQTDVRCGLSATEAARRLHVSGPNQLEARKTKGLVSLLWEQLKATMILVLLAAAALSVLLGDYRDAAAILVIVILNVILGAAQEFRAERAIAALKRLAVPSVRARRDGSVQETAATELVPGDIVLLEAGGIVPADGRVLESGCLRVQEALLTGEAEPVDKNSELVESEEAALGDRLNMVYMGTQVTYGRGVIVITETGMRTQLGRIAATLQQMESAATPLQRRLDRLGRQLTAGALVLVLALFGLGMLQKGELRQVFLTAVSMAVAAIPEGLPAIVTISLALGAQKLLRRGALMRNLPAVEALGSVTVICSDKTGTLTQNRMTAAVLEVAGHRIEIGSTEQEQALLQSAPEAPLSPAQKALRMLLACSLLCNDATPKTGETAAIGDPTESALLTAAERFGMEKPAWDSRFPRVAEIPFDASRRCMTTIHPVLTSEMALPLFSVESGEYIAITKGAIDTLLERCAQVWPGDGVLPMDDAWRRRIQQAGEAMAQEGMRVLGVAYRLLDTLPDAADAGVESDLTFIGLIGLLDPARPEAERAVTDCRRAGIRPILITGDHPLTACALARKLGIPVEQGALTGMEIDRLSPEELAERVRQVSVYARVAPEHKLAIVQALQRQGQVVAMTGDGVNDAPALKQADIGVAMGLQGTDVAREAADIVLLDDNFATIVGAVEEGRTIYANIRKCLKYLLASNVGEIAAMLMAPLLGMPLPLLPLQILWMNLVTDGLPALALGLEPPGPDTLSRPPVRPEEPVLTRPMLQQILLLGLLLGAVSLGAGYLYWQRSHPVWQTMVFTTLTLSQMGNVLAMRSDRRSLFRRNIFANRPLWGAVLLTILLQLALIYVPLLQKIFHTTALTLSQLLLCGALSTITLWAIELGKWIARLRKSASGKGAHSDGNPSHPDKSAHDTALPGLSGILQSTLDNQENGHLTVGEIADRASTSGFGLFLILLALPMLIPLPPGSSGPVGLLFSLLGAQMLWGMRRPWLPQRIRRYRLSAKVISGMRKHGIALVQRLERFSGRRWKFMEAPLPLRLTALMIVVTGVILFLPLPLMNTFPSLLILCIGVGLLNHDGLLTLAGALGCLGIVIFLLVNAHFFLSRLADWISL